MYRTFFGKRKIRNSQPDTITDNPLPIVFGKRCVNHYRTYFKQGNKFLHIPFITVRNIQIINRNRHIGYLVVPTVVVQQANAFPCIKNSFVTDRNIRKQTISLNHIRTFQTQTAPVGRKRTFQPGDIGQCIGADQP